MEVWVVLKTPRQLRRTRPPPATIVGVYTRPQNAARALLSYALEHTYDELPAPGEVTEAMDAIETAADPEEVHQTLNGLLQRFVLPIARELTLKCAELE